MNRPLKLSVLFLSLCIIACANDIYIAQNAAGVANGSSCADAYAYKFFNTAANWGTEIQQIGPGTTVHLCGTVTTFNGSTYDYLRFHGSGTSGNPITLKWENNAVLSVPSCGVNHCITMRGSYLIVDGGSNGILQATDSGTALGHHDLGSGIVGSPCNFCEIKNLAIQNLYIHTGIPAKLASITGNGTTATVSCATACGFGIGDQVGIARNSLFTPAGSVRVASIPTSTTFTFASTTSGTGTGGIAWDNYGGGNGVIISGAGVSIHDNTCHDVLWCFQHTAANGGSVEIYRNRAWNTDHAVAIGNNSAGQTMQSASIHDNEFYDPANWDTYSNVFHHDGIHVYLLGGTTISSPLLIYNNYIHGNWGANSTAYIYIQGDVPSWYVFNNLLVDESGKGTYKIRNNYHAGMVNCYIFNNLFYLGAVPGNSYSHIYLNSCPNIIFSNNITVRAADSGFWWGSHAPLGFVAGGVKGNVYYLVQNHGTNGAWRATTFPLWTKIFSSWINALNSVFPNAGGELESTLSDPALTSDYHLGAGSSAIGKGANLTGLGIPAANLDKEGNPRSASGAWDAGPYNHKASARRLSPAAVVH